MASVDSIISLLATDSLSYEKKLKLKQTGRDQPVFSFAGKRQCRLLDQYSKLTWLTACACPIRNHIFASHASFSSHQQQHGFHTLE